MLVRIPSPPNKLKVSPRLRAAPPGRGLAVVKKVPRPRFVLVVLGCSWCAWLCLAVYVHAGLAPQKIKSAPRADLRAARPRARAPGGWPSFLAWRACRA